MAMRLNASAFQQHVEIVLTVVVAESRWHKSGRAEELELPPVTHPFTIRC
jgi:hypothetical protein